MAVSRIWNGTSWQQPYFLYPKVWNGSNWVYGNPKVWNGSWIDYAILDSQIVNIGENIGSTKIVGDWDNIGYGSVGSRTTMGTMTTGTSAIYSAAITAAYTDINNVFTLTITGATNSGWSSLIFGGNRSNKLDRTNATSFSSGTWKWNGSYPYFGYTIGSNITIEFV